MLPSAAATVAPAAVAPAQALLMLRPAPPRHPAGPVEDERAGIVAGSASVPTFDIPDSEDKDEGIPEFWLTAMSNHDAIGGLISDRDADVLAYLRDIRWGALWQHGSMNYGLAVKCAGVIQTWQHGASMDWL